MERKKSFRSNFHYQQLLMWWHPRARRQVRFIVRLSHITTYSSFQKWIAVRSKIGMFNCKDIDICLLNICGVHVGVIELSLAFLLGLESLNCTQAFLFWCQKSFALRLCFQTKPLHFAMLNYFWGTQ